MKIVLLAVSVVSLVALLVANLVIENGFENDVRGHLKRAADAQTVEMARDELSTAVRSLRSHGLTTGYTSIFYQTPDEDIGFWFRNLDASLNELTTLPSEATLMERSNVLMRLRSTLLHHGDKGETVNEPSGIGLHPYNGLFAMLVALALLLAAATGGLLAHEIR